MSQIVIQASNVIVPTATHQAKKIVRHGPHIKLADKPELVSAQEFWRHHFMSCEDRPARPLAGPIYLHIYLTWPYKASERKSIVKQGELVWRATKPDLDNMAKVITDQLVSCGYIANDACICHLTVAKHYGPVGTFTICLGVLDE